VFLLQAEKGVNICATQVFFIAGMSMWKDHFCMEKLLLEYFSWKRIIP